MTADAETTSASSREDAHHPTEAERNAMRAFLQRTEVRLSTLHRIATAFVGGAGLLILFPVFFREEIVLVISTLLHNLRQPFPIEGTGAPVLLLLLNASIAYPFVLSVAIPLYGFYLLIKDIVHFYFSIYTPGFPHGLVTPSFALTGIGFSPDESPHVKQKALRYQYRPTTVDFMIPFSGQKREAYFDETIYHTNGDIIPSSRKFDDLMAQGVISPETDKVTVERFNAALGLARMVDRNLHEEVATVEASLARHILYLRRLVLRYVGTLMMFIWTTLITFIMIPFLNDPAFPDYLVLSAGYLVWSLFVMRIMRLPIGWIYRHRSSVEKRHIDRQLVILERQVERFCHLAVVLSGIALAISIGLALISTP